MKFSTPQPTVTLSVGEIEEIVAQHLQDELPAAVRLGNLTAADLTTLTSVGSDRTRLTGGLTFELFSKDAT